MKGHIRRGHLDGVSEFTLFLLCHYEMIRSQSETIWRSRLPLDDADGDDGCLESSRGLVMSWASSDEEDEEEKVDDDDDDDKNGYDMMMKVVSSTYLAWFEEQWRAGCDMHLRVMKEEEEDECEIDDDDGCDEIIIDHCDDTPYERREQWDKKTCTLGEGMID